MRIKSFKISKEIVTTNGRRNTPSKSTHIARFLSVFLKKTETIYKSNKSTKLVIFKLLESQANS